MQLSIATLALALSGSAMAAPFKPNGTHIANGTFNFPVPSGSGRPTPTPLPIELPVPSAVTPGSSTPSPAHPSSTGTPVFGSEPASIIASKRGVPTDLSSFASDVKQFFGGEKRGEDLSIPTDLPSFLSDAKSIASAFGTSSVQKRDVPVPTGTPSGTPTGKPTGTPSSVPSFVHVDIPTGIPTGTPTGTPTGKPTPFSFSSIPPFPIETPSSSSKALPTPTGFSLFSFPA